MVRSDKLRALIALIVVSLSLFLFFFLFSDVSQFLVDSLAKIFGETVLYKLVIFGFTAFMISLCYIIPLYIEAKLNKTTFPMWRHLTLVFMGSAIFLGTAYLIIVNGLNFDPNSVLWDMDTQKQYGDLNCKPSDILFTAGSSVECTLNPPVKAFSALIETDYENGSVRQDLIINRVSFVTSENMREVTIKITALDDNLKIRRLETTRIVSFTNPEKVRDLRSRLIRDWFIVLAAAIFSIPSMMINLKNLWK